MGVQPCHERHKFNPCVCGPTWPIRTPDIDLNDASFAYGRTSTTTSPAQAGRNIMVIIIIIIIIIYANDAKVTITPTKRKSHSPSAHVTTTCSQAKLPC
ncbi:hypothetical protein ASPFODRAFT_408649 [Aspergillus luchuensis CBS 106.47]|uniref:Uncharacterized protein n=1 Tax=Aspergillus luchuensis (strain CBS 106.47) TaxID=1137211 RepID=A0A1M3T1Y6_ASPLC|nr:hypothetical protein ASPFODRAFT_408649 [Aspergillus luchuensis CBS 106.47]